MARNLLLILPDGEQDIVVRRMVAVAHDGPYALKSVSRCCDALEILRVQRGAQDYLLVERLTELEMSKALFSVIARTNRTTTLSVDQERAQLTLNSIGDAIISTDVAGRITYLNPIASDMTGWPLSEAYGRPLPDVLKIIDTDTREAAVNPLAMAIRHNEPVGRGTNCVLIRHDGHESAIEDTATPFRTDLGA